MRFSVTSDAHPTKRAGILKLGALLLSLVLGVVLTACGPAASTPQGNGGGEPVSRFHAITGPATAHAAELPIIPILTNPQPQLPVTVIDAQGTEMTITDTSRILPLDLYGTS